MRPRTALCLVASVTLALAVSFTQAAPGAVQYASPFVLFKRDTAAATASDLSSLLEAIKRDDSEDFSYMGPIKRSDDVGESKRFRHIGWSYDCNAIHRCDKGCPAAGCAQGCKTDPCGGEEALSHVEDVSPSKRDTQDDASLKRREVNEDGPKKGFTHWPFCEGGLPCDPSVKGKRSDTVGTLSPRQDDEAFNSHLEARHSTTACLTKDCNSLFTKPKHGKPHYTGADSFDYSDKQARPWSQPKAKQGGEETRSIEDSGDDDSIIESRAEKGAKGQFTNGGYGNGHP